jgi:hypothetical protein
MHIQHYVTEALEMVIAREIPDEDFARAVNDQVRLMAGYEPDEPWETLTC